MPVHGRFNRGAKGYIRTVGAAGHHGQPFKIKAGAIGGFGQHAIGVAGFQTVVLRAFAVPVLAIVGGWTLHNGLRYDDYTLARGANSGVPFYRLVSLGSVNITAP